MFEAFDQRLHGVGGERSNQTGDLRVHSSMARRTPGVGGADYAARVRETGAESTRFSLKDHLFNRDKVELLAAQVHASNPQFAADAFVEDVVARFPALELKERIAWIAECLRQHLPDDYATAVAVILQALPEPLDETLGDGDFGDFIYAPYSHFVAQHGCSAQDLDVSLGALRAITMRFSAEDAIRAFINAFPEQTLGTLLIWAEDPNYHVRRLCSEGTRPTLPWSRKLKIPADAALPILAKLYADPTRYVTRSVANHLNDISKLAPDLTIATLRRWQAAGDQDAAEMTFIIRHATRTLIKKGHLGALALWGMSPDPRVSVTDFVLTTEVVVGEALEFSFDLAAEESAELIIDYIVRFQGANGTLSGRKVFKLKQLSLTAGEPIRVTKRHPFRANMTTRQLYPGSHEIQLQINGTDHGIWSFNLATPS